MKRSLVVLGLIPVLTLQSVAPALALPDLPKPAADGFHTARGEAEASSLPKGVRPRKAEPPVRPRRAEPPRGVRPRRFVYDAPNGIKIVVDGRKVGRDEFVATATLSAPSGEAMTFDFADAGRFGPSVLIDDELLLGYRLSRSGQVTSIAFNDGERTLVSRRAGPPHRRDNDAYLALAGALAERHSPEFLREIEVALHQMNRDYAVPAQARDWIECALGVTGFVVSIWGLVAGCAVAGIPTLGASCIFAILAHEAAVASAILSCIP